MTNRLVEIISQRKGNTAQSVCDLEYNAACEQREKHRMALKRLRNKKGKINVVFFVISVSCWKLDSVYNRMLRNDRYNPIILVCPQCDRGEEFKIEQLDSCFEYFHAKGYNVIKSYNVSTGEYVDARVLEPDIIFYTNPYEGLIDNRYYISQFCDVLTCYVNYAFLNNDERWTASLPLHKSVWKYFCEFDLARHLNKLGVKWYYDNRVIVGYPVYDQFVDSGFNGNAWKLPSSTHRRVIFAPHHTIESDGWIHYSMFLYTSDIMEQMRDKYKDRVQFVFKPHPLLKTKLYKTEGWGKDKTDAYYRRWAESDNSSIAEGDYIDLFKSSDAMIHDCGSFIVEYLCVNKPAMHLNSGRIKEELNDEARIAYQAHYLMENLSDIETFIIDVVLGGHDEKLESRLAAYEKLLLPPNGRSVAENIINEIDDEISRWPKWLRSLRFKNIHL